MQYIFFHGSNALRSYSRLRSIILGLPFQAKIEKKLLELILPVFFSSPNYDDVLHIRYLKCQPFLIEAWPSCNGV